MPTLDATIMGRVQGVGFRAFVAREARGLGVGGAVWNRADGAVRVRATGPRETLERLARRLGEGPAAARIHSVTIDWSDASTTETRFEIRASASE